MTGITEKKRQIAYRQGRVLEQRLMGDRQADIAQIMGVSTPTVSKDLDLMRKMALPPLKSLLKRDMRKGSEHPLSPKAKMRIAKRRDGVLELRLQNKTADEIAQELKVSHGTVIYDIATLRKESPPDLVRRLDEADKAVRTRHKVGKGRL